MKFYSEITKELYDTPDALAMAEKAVAEEQKKKEEIARATAAIRAKKEADLKQAIDHYFEAESNVHEKMEDFLKSYGPVALEKLVACTHSNLKNVQILSKEDHDKLHAKESEAKNEQRAEKPEKKEIVKEFHCKSPEDVAEMLADIFGTLYEAMGCDEDDEEDEDEDERPPLPHPFSLFF